MLLKLAGLSWARETLSLTGTAINMTDADIRHITRDFRPEKGAADRVELLADASINELGGRGMSPETKDIFHRVREFLSYAARTLAEREELELKNQLTFHQSGADDESASAPSRAEMKAAAKKLEFERAAELRNRIRTLRLKALELAQ